MVGCVWSVVGGRGQWGCTVVVWVREGVDEMSVMVRGGMVWDLCSVKMWRALVVCLCPVGVRDRFRGLSDAATWPGIWPL